MKIFNYLSYDVGIICIELDMDEFCLMLVVRSD